MKACRMTAVSNFLEPQQIKLPERRKPGSLSQQTNKQNTSN